MTTYPPNLTRWANEAAGFEEPPSIPVEVLDRTLAYMDARPFTWAHYCGLDPARGISLDLGGKAKRMLSGEVVHPFG